MSINQEDATEKSEQIGEMHHVYREATRVAVCLGYFDSGFGCVARFLQWAKCVQDPAGSNVRRWTQFELVEQLREFDVSLGNLRGFLDKMKIDLENLGNPGTEEIGCRISKDQVLGFEESSVVASPMKKEHPFFVKIFEILEHEWFSRLWTYQEYFLVHTYSSLDFLLEDHTVPRGTFLDVQQVALDTDGPRLWQNPLLHMRAREILDRRAFEHPFHLWHGSNASLWSLLQVSCQRRATVASDHVFAVIGLMEPEMRSRILVDYSRSVASIFTDTFEIAINHEGDGLRLPRCWERLALIPPITPGLPSWCPDLNNESQVSICRYPWAKFSDCIPAIYDKLANMRVSPSEKSLHLRVMKADVVAQVVKTPCPSIPPSATGYTSREDYETNFAGLLGTWFLEMSSTLGSMDGQEDYPVFEPGLDALLWQYLSPWSGFSRQAVMDGFFPECSKVDHECIVRRHLTDPRWCFRKLLSYIRLVKCFCGKVLHQQHRRLGAHYHEECTTCVLSRDPKLLSSAHRCGVHLDRLSCHMGSSRLPPSGEERLLTALLNIVGALGFFMHGTYIVKTAAGRYGHASRCPSVGDHVCVVPGGELLHIISADNSRYVGAASVGGLMGDDILEQYLFPDPEDRFEEVVLY